MVFAPDAIQGAKEEQNAEEDGEAGSDPKPPPIRWFKVILCKIERS
jgi:hypothetical protein